MRNIILAALAAILLAFVAAPATAGSRYHDNSGDQALEFLQGFLNGLSDRPRYRYNDRPRYYDDYDDYEYSRPRRNNNNYRQKLREYREICRLERQMLEEGIDFEPKCRFRNQ